MTSDKATVIFGVHPVRELLRAKQRPIYNIFVAKPLPKAWSEIERLVPRHVAVTFMPREQLTIKSGTTDHQGMVAVVGTLPIRSSCFDVEKQPMIVLLDGIQDSRNLGAIIRSASCAGINGVIVPQKGSAPLDGVVAKASAGLLEYMPIYQPISSATAVQEIQRAGYALYLATCGGDDIRFVEFQLPLCLVIGSEGLGITPSLLKKGKLITIPQRVPDISYNASVAAGIIFFFISSVLKKI